MRCGENGKKFFLMGDRNGSEDMKSSYECFFMQMLSYIFVAHLNYST